MLTHTHTYAILELSPAAYDEIRGKLEEAGYQDQIHSTGKIDMYGIAVSRGEESPQEP